MVNVLQIGNVGTELSKLVHVVSDHQTQILIESEGKPVVAMIHYDYLVNLLEALEDAIDGKVLKQAVASNDEFFGFEFVHNAKRMGKALLSALLDSLLSLLPRFTYLLSPIEPYFFG